MFPNPYANEGRRTWTQDDVDLQVGSFQQELQASVSKNKSECGCFQILLIGLSFLLPIILVSTWFLTLTLIDEDYKDISLSGAIGTPKWKVINVCFIIISVILFSWIILVRNVQIRKIFAKFPQYNKPLPNDPNTVEFTDYVCKCCCHCRADGCGGPIYHNKHRDGNCVKSCKYYCTTFRGVNFISSILIIIGWIGLVLIYIFDVYEHTLQHIIYTFTAAVFIYTYHFIHFAVLCQQRQSEYQFLKWRGRNFKICRMCCFCDVVWSICLPSFGIAMYWIHALFYSYFTTVVLGKEYFDDVDDSLDYTYEWAGISSLAVNFMIYAYIFYENNTYDELADYAIYAKYCCLC
eukprot:UN02653